MRTTKSFDRLNRLTGITSIEAQSALLSSFSNVGRRVSKKVGSNAEGTGSPDVDLRFAYDNWNLIAVLGPDFSPIVSFTWGTDLSGTLQGAGGVGGLLSVTMHSGPSAGTYFCCYDGNGNVTALVSANDARVAARYEYGPFGEVLRADGPACEMNPFRFSTKYQDEETDLLYYGYRYYNASTGRWLSRDPIGIRGGLNLYGFVGNSSLDRFDRLGLDYLPYPFPHNTDTTTYRVPKPGKRCGSCGPEVGTALLKTLQEVNARFSKLDDQSKKSACDKLELAGRWDITFPDPPKGCGEGDCAGTVSIGGKCYSSWVVNYSLFGRIAKLCGFYRTTMDAMILGNKGVIKPILQTITEERYQWQYTEDVRTFADLGYDMNLSASLPPSSHGYGDCKKCNKTVPQSAFKTD